MAPSSSSEAEQSAEKDVEMSPANEKPNQVEEADQVEAASQVEPTLTDNMASYGSQTSGSSQYHGYAAGSGSPVDGTEATNYNQTSNAVDPNLDEQQHLAALQQLTEAAVSQEAEASQNAAQVASQAALAAAAAAQKAQHTRRVPQACDACSQRKVKCDEQPQCKNCRDLGVTCTRDRQRRRRGPPNKVKEAIEMAKRARTSFPQDVATASGGAYSFGQTQSSTDLIAAPEIISQIISSFFTYIYPLHPFPNELWLNQVYQRRADISTGTGYNPVLALMASMVGVVAALRPRHIFPLVSQAGYTDVASFIQRARSICMNSRGIGFLEQNDLDANSAATSYFLALISAHTGQWLQYQRYLGEAVTILHGVVNQPQNAAHDELRRQTAYRVYWAIFVLSRSFDMVDQPTFRAKPKLPYEPVLPYPEGVPDEAIQADRILEVEGDSAQSIAVLALTAEVQLHSAGEIPPARSSVPTAAEGHEASHTITELLDAPAAIRHALDRMSPQMIELINSSAPQRENHDGSFDIRKEIQRAHVMLASLLMRAHLIDRGVAELTRGSRSPPAQADQILSLEREHVARGLAYLLKDIPTSALEPDAVGFMDNVRKILQTLFRDPKILASYGAPLQGLEGILSRIAAGSGIWGEAEEFSNQAELKGRQEEFSATETGRELVTFS